MTEQQKKRAEELKNRKDLLNCFINDQELFGAFCAMINLFIDSADKDLLELDVSNDVKKTIIARFVDNHIEGLRLIPMQRILDYEK